jgi:hypothetical protein
MWNQINNQTPDFKGITALDSFKNAFNRILVSHYNGSLPHSCRLRQLLQMLYNVGSLRFMTDKKNQERTDIANHPNLSGAIEQILLEHLHPLSVDALAGAIRQQKHDFGIILLQNEGIPFDWGVRLLPLIEAQVKGGES